MKFEEACRRVEEVLERQWKSVEDGERLLKLEREKRAIMGYEKEAGEYKAAIRQIIEQEELVDAQCPPWYRSLEEGIFHELYGLAGLAPWAYDESPQYRESSSAKLIGDRLYCLIDGVSRLQPQTINRRRREQLKRALLLASPEERLEEGFHEIYLSNGIRITIYSGDRTKEGQDVMVFRKYLLKELSFDEMIRLKTIPEEAKPLFAAMTAIGFNVLFAGPVRSGKTTFMQVWQRWEDPSLEGLAISTDPETPWHIIMPDAPIMQIVADGQRLESITKSLLRGDNDYVLLEEMRDAAAYRLALEITSTGTRRSKATIHTDDPVNLPFRMASKICERYGGSLRGIIQQIFRNFNYVLEFCQNGENRAEKKLKGIWEYCYDPEQDQPSVHLIAKYDFGGDCWRWKYHMGEDKKEIGSLFPEKMKEMEETMKELENRNPIMEKTVIYPRYYLPYRYENPERC